MCWACSAPAKGQKHYKENPNHWDDAGTILPVEVTRELRQKFGNQSAEWINLKLCALCPNPKCRAVNQKEGKDNLMHCVRCQEPFCYICNKPIKGEQHYEANNNCKRFSDPFSDF